MFHQNESGFKLSCNLNTTCGVSYRTFPGYKAHVYRHHSAELTTKIDTKIGNNAAVDDQEQKDEDLNVELDLMYGDDTDDDSYLFNDLGEFDLSNNSTEKRFDLNVDQKETMTTMVDVKRSYASFILQLRGRIFGVKNNHQLHFILYYNTYGSFTRFISATRAAYS